jgi:hypothetical protein
LPLVVAKVGLEGDLRSGARYFGRNSFGQLTFNILTFGQLTMG